MMRRIEVWTGTEHVTVPMFCVPMPRTFENQGWARHYRRLLELRQWNRKLYNAVAEHHLGDRSQFHRPQIGRGWLYGKRRYWLVYPNRDRKGATGAFPTFMEACNWYRNGGR
jgi:hypothetical protein